MGEIKSAWEIAKEKANKLGTLSPEEQKRQNEERCQLIGKALAEKYLSQQDVSQLETELSKHTGQDRKLVNQAVFQRLIEEINLRYRQKLETVSRAILILTKAGASIEIMDRIKELFQEYQEAEDREKQEIERAGREMLHRLRISGTAISQINIHATGEWHKMLNELARPFEQRLSDLKQEFLHSLTAQPD
ncbi:MAG TPA: hypothetical protein EYP71_07660 [Dehalococcoidia bacterium]|nr:hypothetical protein [Dehalococcoidia bacterium]